MKEKEVELKVKRQFIKGLIVNRGTCNILNYEDIKIVNAIKKDILFLNSLKRNKNKSFKLIKKSLFN